LGNCYICKYSYVIELFKATAVVQMRYFPFGIICSVYW